MRFCSCRENTYSESMIVVDVDEVVWESSEDFDVGAIEVGGSVGWSDLLLSVKRCGLDNKVKKRFGTKTIGTRIIVT